VRLTPRKFPLGWLLTLLVAGAGAVLVIPAMRTMLATTPSRDATADLGPYGLITLSFSTDPNPPLPTGTVTLSLMPMDARRRTVVLDRIAFEYGRVGDDRPAGAGEAERMADGSGMFVGGAQFPGVGNWWVRTTTIRGEAQAEVRFTFYVEPAQ